MKNTMICQCLTGVALAAILSACGAGSVPADEDGAESAVAVKVNELASVGIGDARITFLQTEGEQDISIEEEASIYAKQTPMQQLWGRGLTSLELFMSLAPDQIAPEALVAAHAREAEVLGRDGDDIAPVDLDLAPTLEKSVTPSQCDVMWRRPYTSSYGDWVNKARLDNQTSTARLCGGMSCSHTYEFPDEVILMGICNSSSSRYLPYHLRDKPYYSSTWRITSRSARPETINANYRIHTIPYSHAIEGRPSPGSGVTYHLRAAIGSHL